MTQANVKYRPLRTNVLVKLLNEEVKETESGIIIDATKKIFQDNGVVVATSNFVKDKNTLKEGDKVFFGKYSGVKVEYKKENLLLLSYNEILGIFNGIKFIDVIQSTHMDGLLNKIQKTVDKMTDKEIKIT